MKLQTIDDALRDIQCQRSKLILLLSDCAPYMQAAGKTVKNLYPHCFHVFCTAHSLHNKICAHFHSFQ